MLPTPHNEAGAKDFAKTVLMPGDPLRAKFVAENFLEGARLVNNVRGIQGYTGSFEGRPVSVMASGMGIPSICIYAFELFNFYGVENIIRTGSAGAIQDSVRLRDVILGISASSDSNFAGNFGLPGTYAPTASFELLSLCKQKADELKIAVKTGEFFSTDAFYDDMGSLADWKKMHNVLAVEMETAGLYMTAARAGKNALSICTVSDAPLRNESLSSKDRERSLTDMLRLALHTAAAL